VICRGINHMLGRANDDPQTLRRAAKYLEDWAIRHSHTASKAAVANADAQAVTE
jgi:hypothetical protein